MHIRKVSSEQKKLVTHLFNQCRMFYAQASDMGKADVYLKERLDSNESVVFVALDGKGDGETPVGFTQLYPTYSSVKAVKTGF